MNNCNSTNIFDGYEFNGERYQDNSEGGYIYAEPGMYHDAMLLDIESLHPSLFQERKEE